MVAASGEEARRNGDNIDTGYSGMCQMFVREHCWQVPSLYASAIDAWNGATKKHPGDRTPPEGAPVYYRGGNYGHAALSQGGGRIRSTDAPSGGRISDQNLDWPERSWGYEYLGWTGDLNGVDLPITGEDDEVKPEDIEAIAKRVNQTLGDYKADGTKRDDVGPDPDQADARIRQIENKVDKLLDKVDKLLDKA